MTHPITPDTNDDPSRAQRLVKFISGLSPWNLHRGEEALNEYMLDTFMELTRHAVIERRYNPITGESIDFVDQAELRKAIQERLKP